MLHLPVSVEKTTFKGIQEHPCTIYLFLSRKSILQGIQEHPCTSYLFLSRKSTLQGIQQHPCTIYLFDLYPLPGATEVEKSRRVFLRGDLVKSGVCPSLQDSGIVMKKNKGAESSQYQIQTDFQKYLYAELKHHLMLILENINYIFRKHQLYFKF